MTHLPELILTDYPSTKPATDPATEPDAGRAARCLLEMMNNISRACDAESMSDDLVDFTFKMVGFGPMAAAAAKLGRC